VIRIGLLREDFCKSEKGEPRNLGRFLGSSQRLTREERRARPCSFEHGGGLLRSGKGTEKCGGGSVEVR